MQHLRLRIAHAATLLHTGGIAFVKYACRCLVRQGREAAWLSTTDQDRPRSDFSSSITCVHWTCVQSVGIWRRASATGWPEGWNGVFSCDWTWNTSELIQLNWTEHNCDEPVDCTELVTIVRDLRVRVLLMTMIMIMMSHAMYCKSVTSRW